MANIELTAAQTRELVAIEQAVNTLRESLRRAEAAGMDVSELTAKLEKANAQRQGMLQQFSPDAVARRQR